MKKKQSWQTRIKSAFLKGMYWLLLGIRAIIFPLTKIPFVIIIIAIGYYALSINDQGQDLMAAFTSRSILEPYWYLVLFYLFLMCWAISIWNVSRILLTTANLRKLVEEEIRQEELEKEKIFQLISKKKWIVASIDGSYRKVLHFMIKWTPRFLALWPYLIFIEAYSKQSRAFKIENPSNLIVIVLLAIAHMAYMVFRKPISARLPILFKGEKNINQEEVYPLEEQKDIIKAIRQARIFTNTILTILMTIIMFAYAVWAAQETPSLDGKPGLIILAGLTIYTLIGLVLNLLINRFKIPLFALAVIIALFIFSKYNNNHTIQTLRTPADTMMLHNRNQWSDSAYADQWLAHKLRDSTLDRTKEQTVFIVAAEGGGIRNCYWTYRVLRELHEMNPTFYDRTFAVTGVSGGSIGLGFYYNYRYLMDTLTGKSKSREELDSAIDIVCSADYLSAVTYAFLFPDLLQRFIPAPINSWDRSKYLANSFDAGFSSHLATAKSKQLTRNYLSMWDDTGTRYKHPVILFNTIFNEDGIKAIYSPYRLSDTYYTGVMDLLYETQRPVPMKEAMVSSARFPILTAPGLIWHDTLNLKTNEPDSVKLGHISDGGGYENTAIQTAIQTALLLRSSIDSLKLRNIKVKVIYIGTGTSAIEIGNKIPSDKMKHKEATGKFYELAWLSGSANTIFGWIKSSHNMTTRLKPDLSILQFGLAIRNDKNVHTLPLGWFLSDSSRANIVKQAAYPTANAGYRANMDKFKGLQ